MFFAVTAHRVRIQSQAQTGGLRSDEASIFQRRHRLEDAGRTRHVLDEIAVGDRCEQVDVHLGKHVTTYGHVVRLREGRDAPPWRNAADAAEVDDRDTSGFLLEQSRELA